VVETNDNDIGNVTDVRSLKEKWEGNGKGIHEGSGQSCGNGKGTGNLPMSENILSGDCGAFQNGSARTRSDADVAHMRKASGIMQMRQTRQMQIDEDACIRN